MPPPDLVASFPWKPEPWSRQKESSELEPSLEQNPSPERESSSEQKSSLELEASLRQEESPGLETSLEQKSLPERELPLEPDASLKIPRIHAVQGNNLQSRIYNYIYSYLLDRSRAHEDLKRQIDDHIHSQDSSHEELVPNLRADERMLQILSHSFPEENRVRLSSLQDELRTFIHLLEAVKEEAVEKKDAGKEAAEKEVAKEELLEKDEASIGGLHDRFVAYVTPEAVEEKAFGKEDGKQLPRN